MRINAIVEESIVDGPGLRYAVFVQGCPHRCPGCHNPQTHDRAGGYDISADGLIESFMRCASENPLLAGVTVSGGEPFEQARELTGFLKAVRREGFDVWVYTGWTIGEILGSADKDELELLENIDTLVDGRFEESSRTLERPFMGSANQRIIKNPASYSRQDFPAGK
ncbi:MAG: anaerobic ribonucleoside-triphosphate reductase activating protein [Synergistaceae bacterium]|jgi:anaerobic ribonucleoside-triphosphate reductase activating protein|nr:anaerobic ribonucleoside-triphosphate reductase activating protein [Synergistaceae bacterium]